MKTIYKYTLRTTDDVSLGMPEGARLLSLQVQGSYPVCPCIWALVDTSNTMEERSFRTFCTGHPIPDDFTGTFVGTYQLAEGALVFHVFDVTRHDKEE